MMRPGSLTTTFRIEPAGTRVLWADRVGPWLVVLADYPAGNGLRWHAHGHASFHLTVRGASDERYWKIDRGKLAGTSQFYAPGVGHETTFGPGGAVVLHAACDPAVVDGAGVLAEPDPKPMLGVLRALGRGDDAASLEVESACAALAESVAGGARAERATPRWALDVYRRLFEAPDDLPTLASLATEAGVHPAHLARTFRASFGRTIGSFARVRRLQIAADALVTGDTPISMIAYDAGFCDQSHFGRAFAAHYGTTPARFRAEIRRGPVISVRP
ncbi:MAG: AraC family transcriptional regulator [Planctomycetota bacterium]